MIKLKKEDEANQHPASQRDYRCPLCKRLLMRGQIVKIEIRCPKCKKIISLYE
jgi:phage FluMu protein Com